MPNYFDFKKHIRERFKISSDMGIPRTFVRAADEVCYGNRSLGPHPACQILSMSRDQISYFTSCLALMPAMFHFVQHSRVPRSKY